MSITYSGLGPARISNGPVQAVTAFTTGTGTSNWTQWNKEKGMVEISGTFGGATVTMVARHKDRTSVEIPVTTEDGTLIELTSNRIFYIRLPSTYELAIKTAGGTSSSINMYFN